MFEYAEGMDYISKFTHSGKPVRDLSRMEKLLDCLDNPQDRLSFVHIAGTNGKGSMAQMFSEIFTLSGLKTGLFTSPFLIEYADRIKVNGKNIDNNSLNMIVQDVKTAVDRLLEKDDFSQFEITQAIAFLYFRQQKCDIVVLETGLGGLLDCTNVVTTSILTVIGSIDYDHTAILGNTLEEIATQKAGIIKEHIPCVLSAGNNMAVIKTVREKAMEKTAQLVIPNITLMRLLKCDCFGSQFEYKGSRYTTSMGGAHQVLNAMSVIEGIHLINDKLKIPHDIIAGGIEKAVLTGRAEVISKSPLTILDGAHNPDGLSALAGIIEHCDKRPCHAIIGMCRDKNIVSAVKKLIPMVESFITVDGFCDRSADKNELAEIINSEGGNACPSTESLENEVIKMQENNADGLNIICGSLYLVSFYKTNCK